MRSVTWYLTPTLDFCRYDVMCDFVIVYFVASGGFDVSMDSEWWCQPCFVFYLYTVVSGFGFGSWSLL